MRRQSQIRVPKSSCLLFMGSFFGIISNHVFFHTGILVLFPNSYMITLVGPLKEHALYYYS